MADDPQSSVILPGSGSAGIRQLSQLSNIGEAGQWIYRIDLQRIQPCPPGFTNPPYCLEEGETTGSSGPSGSSGSSHEFNAPTSSQFFPTLQNVTGFTAPPVLIDPPTSSNLEETLETHETHGPLVRPTHNPAATDYGDYYEFTYPPFITVVPELVTQSPLPGGVQIGSATRPNPFLPASDRTNPVQVPVQVPGQVPGQVPVQVQVQGPILIRPTLVNTTLTPTDTRRPVVSSTSGSNFVETPVAPPGPSRPLLESPQPPPPQVQTSTEDSLPPIRIFTEQRTQRPNTRPPNTRPPNTTPRRPNVLVTGPPGGLPTRSPTITNGPPPLGGAPNSGIFNENRSQPGNRKQNKNFHFILFNFDKI